MIHKFKQGDLYIVLDVNSGAIHVIDELVYNVLDYYPNPEIDKMKLDYSREEILEAMEC